MVRTITVYTPGGSFPSVSVTGPECSLMCDHCRGHYLSSMKDVSKDGALIRFASELWRRGGKGFLLSGGCDPSGRIPYPGHVLEQIREVKRTTGLVVNAHTGLVDDGFAHELAEAGVDCFSFDVVADDRILHDVMHMEGSSQDVKYSLLALSSTNVRTVPHILAGISGEIGEAEERALRMVQESSSQMVVLIVHIPTKGTPLGKRDPPDSDHVIDFARSMRSALVGRELVIGCMRPKGDPHSEIGIINAGFDGIVQPSSRTMSWVRSEGMNIVEVDGCCAPYPSNNRA